MPIGGILSGAAGGATVAIVIKAVDQFSGAFKGADTKMKMLSASAKATGIAIAGVGAGLLALSVASVKTAIEFEETASKFATVFQNVSAESERTAKNLEKNFGLSSLAAKQLLSDTGDLLSGFGFTAEEALNMSNQVNELAVDLASFTNIEGGAERASQALTKALLGERESVKSLGIAILETDINQKAYEMGMLSLNESGKGFTGTLTRQEKAQVTLQIAMEQSKNAIGDYARTSDSAANRVRLIERDFENLKTEMGQELLPTFEKLTTALIDNSDQLKIAGKSIGTFINGIATGVIEAIKYLELLGGTIGVVASIVASKELTFKKDFSSKMTTAVDDIFGGKSITDKTGVGSVGGAGGLGGIGSLGGAGGLGDAGGLGGAGGGRAGLTSIESEEEDVLRNLLEAKRSNIELENELEGKFSDGTITQLEYQEAMTQSNTKVSQSTIAAVNFGYEMEYLTKVMGDVAVAVARAREQEEQKYSLSKGSIGGKSFALTGSAAMSAHNQMMAAAQERDRPRSASVEDYGDSLSYVNEHGVRVNQVATGTQTSSSGGTSITMSFYNQANPQVVAQQIAEAESARGVL